MSKSEQVYENLITDGRKLVTVRKIDKLEPIDGADRIETAHIDGWTVVVKNGEFNVGDSCMFFEIDSLIPHVEGDTRFEFLKDSLRKYRNASFYRIRTVKKKGQLSQGLAMPCSLFPEIPILQQDVGYDNILNVSKYDPEEHLSMPNEWSWNRGNSSGDRPEFVPKTDEERIQNLWKKYSVAYRDVPFAKSLKLDGSSISIVLVKNNELNVPERLKNSDRVDDYGNSYDFFVCSRNFIKTEHDSSNDYFWQGVRNEEIEQKIKNFPYPIVLQGEVMGPGIQKNREGLERHQVFLFRIWFPLFERFATHDEFLQICKQYDLKTVPQFGVCKPFMVHKDVKELLKESEIASLNNPIAEGVVYRSTVDIDGEMIHFKAINNQFLLKEK